MTQDVDLARIANATTDPEAHEGNEVTPEMIEDGAAAIFEWREFSTAWDLADIVYRAMERARLIQLVHWLKQLVQGDGRFWPGLLWRIWSRRTVWAWHCARPDRR
jgi:hypothetical protein